MIVQHDEIKELLKDNKLNSTNEYIIYGTEDIKGYWIVLSDRGVTLLPVAEHGNLTGEIMPLGNDKIGSITLKKGILSNKLIITDKQNTKATYRVASRLTGNKQHHQDFLKVVEKYGK